MDMAKSDGGSEPTHAKAPEPRLFRQTALPSALSAGLHRLRGITLIELMVVLVILAILTVAALPSYQQHLLKARRAQAKAALMQAASLQETYFLNRKRYASDMRDLGYPTNPALLDANSQYLPAVASSGFIYQIGLVNVTATSYTLTATPLKSDTLCNVLTLTATGRKGVSGGTQTVTFCW